MKQLLLKKPKLKKEIHEFAKENCRLRNTIKDTFAAAENILRLIELGRTARHKFRTTFRGARSPADPKNIPWNNTPYVLPASPILVRLNIYQKKCEEHRLEQIRVRVRGILGGKRRDQEDVKRLPEGAPFSEVTADAWCSEGEKYSSRCYYRKTSACYHIKITHDYEGTVVASNIDVINGLLTIAALKVETGRAGEDAWRAKWIAKGRGFSFNVQEGYIVRRDGKIAHGPTLSAARSTLTRRDGEAKIELKEASLLLKLEANREEEMTELGDVKVSISDSISAGNCGSGTRAFRDRHFPARDWASVIEVLKAARGTSECRLAISACMVAIRRHKNKEKLCDKNMAINSL